MTSTNTSKEMLPDLSQIKSFLGDSSRVLDEEYSTGKKSFFFKQIWRWEAIGNESTNNLLTKGDDLDKRLMEDHLC